MSARIRVTRRTATAAAIALTAALTTLLVPTAADAASHRVLNGTSKANGLTISDGSTYVVMNGTRVNFGVHVRDLAWSPDGKKAAFIDGQGNLEVANANATGRHIVSVNPGHQTWSHPTWQVAKADPRDHVEAKNNLIFTANKGGTTRLMTISATAYHRAPSVLALGRDFGPDVSYNPTTGNNWASAAGGYGTSVYDNTRNGEVYLRDDYLRQMGGAVTRGSEPALSPNGEEIVFVRAVKGHDHLFTSDIRGKHVKDITPHATTDYTEPAWSANGKTIAFRTPTGTDTVPANGSKAPVRVSSYTGLVAYRG
ncbi:TolB family protein [Streptacidiphilus sp. N1-3]|uniref:TolB family protein n=1 Tax=Streptacidiphilus alkalitolerans TaxID=3342712 RepID=A0ABV6WYT3_9ACTN